MASERAFLNLIVVAVNHFKHIVANVIYFLPGVRSPIVSLRSLFYDGHSFPRSPFFNKS